MPDFTISYEPDFRQKIADSWPRSLDDSSAKTDWDWSYDISLDDLTKKVIDCIDDSHKQRLLKNNKA